MAEPPNPVSASPRLRVPRVLLAVAVAVAGGCRSGSHLRVDGNFLYEGNAAATYLGLEAEGKKGIAKEDEALWRCEIGSAALCAGNEEAAFRAFDGASRLMGTLESTSAENARAIFGSEDTKVWKGDPHERCMNAYYKGILYYRRGDIDNASACFKRGLLADAWSREGESQVDFAALSYLLGWASARKGKSDQQEFSFREAKEHAPGLPEPRPESRNVLIVADLGAGPVKHRDGSEGEIVRFQRVGYPERALEILVDGRVAGRTAMATDLYHQATTRGKRVLDGVRKGKAIFKTGAAVAGAVILSEGLDKNDGGAIAAGIGLLLLSALTRAEADVRHWTLLPGEIHLLPLDVAPGRHLLTVRMLDDRGAPMPGFERAFDIDVPPSGDRLYYFRTCGTTTIYGLLDPAAPANG